MTEQHEDDSCDDFWDSYDYCYECTGYGDDYRTGLQLPGLPKQTRMVGRVASYRQVKRAVHPVKRSHCPVFERRM